MLTWIMFLKFLDDMEQIAEQEARMAGKRFRPALEPPYRWRDWAAKPEGITGDELISFVNNEEAVRPNGTKGPGLFAICVVCKAPTAATVAMSLRRFSKAP